MHIIKSYKITPNIISRYKSNYLLKISQNKDSNGSWFIYNFNKYYNIHSLEPLGLVKSLDNEIIFDNNQSLITKNIDNKTVFYYGSVDLLFNIKLMIPIEEKLPSSLSIEEIEKKYNAIKNLPYFQAVYIN